MAPTVFGSQGKGHVDVQVYDFKRPERVSKDQMRALEALHEGFGRNFGAALSGYLRTIVEVNVANIEQLTYSELPIAQRIISPKPGATSRQSHFRFMILNPTHSSCRSCRRMKRSSSSDL